MPNRTKPDQTGTLRAIRTPLALTRLGMLAEQMLRAFWPFFSIVMILLAVLMSGLHEVLPVEAVWCAAVVGLLATLAAVLFGVRRFHWPTRDAALTRLDGTLRGRPIQALLDDQVIGREDPASKAVWQAHQKRMAARAAGARAARPDLRLARRDPYALRYVAILALTTALLFGSVWRVNSIADMAPGLARPAETASWEGWVEPPRHTGLPTLYLADIDTTELEIPQNSRITLRFYGPVGALRLAETVSGRTDDRPPATDQAQDFTVTQDGALQIDGAGGQSWEVVLAPDEAPQIWISGTPTSDATGNFHLPYAARDDYGVVTGTALIELDLVAVDRRMGLAIDPEPRDAIEAPLTMPIAGDRRDFTEDFIENFSRHPWAHLPVRITLSAGDAAGQVTLAEPFSTPLLAGRFFDPLAAAIVEQRRDLLWSRENSKRVSQVLRAISHRPGDVFRSETAYLRLRFILRRLETMSEHGLREAQRDEIAEALWELAMAIEAGDLGNALERLRRAQERLSQAMKDGASDEEIAGLMRELRAATNDYLRQLGRQAQQNDQQPGDNPQQQGDSVQMSQNDLQRMMDRIQELMEQGRMAEAQQALEELQQLMENMRVTMGQGQGQSDGQQAMEELADTLREQQGLSDQAFRELQEQFNPGARSGESQGNEGRDGGAGRGESHSGQSGEGSGQGDPTGEQGQGSLADQQQALRGQLRDQLGQLPDIGGEAEAAARDALDRAGRAMEGAEDSLRQDDHAGAIDQQSEAMEALREGIRSLGEAMAQQSEGQFGQGSEAGGQQAGNRDPLGRNSGSRGMIGTEENLMQGNDVYRRARELLDELRRRSGETERSRSERDYLRRLLDRF